MGEVAKSIGRRLFARATVGVPLALKGGAVPSMVPSGGGYPGSPLGMAASAAEAAKQTFMQKVWQSVRTNTRTTQEMESIRYTRRAMMGGLDPDLAVLNSMALQHRAQIQIERELVARRAERSLRHRIIKSMGGDPEEFE